MNRREAIRELHDEASMYLCGCGHPKWHRSGDHRSDLCRNCNPDAGFWNGPYVPRKLAVACRWALDRIFHLEESLKEAKKPKAFLRPEVLSFAIQMELKLRANDHKPGWKNDTPDVMYNRLFEELSELSDAINCTPRPGGILEESVDCANILMMVADTSGELKYE